MKLEELSMALKDTAEMIDSAVSSAESKSCEAFCKEYIKKYGLEYIREEIEQAFRHGFFVGVKQQRLGKFKRFEEKMK